MTRDALVRGVLRGVALVIAVAAIIDPAITADRPSERVVLVSVDDSARDGRLADAVARALRGKFSVVRAPIAGASAAVIVGNRLPKSNDEVPTPSFVVVADSSQTNADVERVEVPATATLDERVPVRALVSVRNAAGRSLELTLRAGSAVVDRVTRRVAGESTLIVPMSFVAASLGPVSLRVSAKLDGAESPAVADAALNVVNRRGAILVFDPRPSWTSTFVRRALERDPQFVVTSRIVTSRNVSNNSGQPPATLGDQVALAQFDAVVIGAPNALTAADVSGLEAFMRRRGGSVIFLLDDSTAGPYERLARASGWSESRSVPTTFTLDRSDSITLRVGDVVAPSSLPAGASVIAGKGRPVVWETPVGAGRLIVSGAVDAWRFRDPSLSTFDRFWRTLVADAAASAPPPVLVEATPAMARPGETVDVNATLRDAALEPDTARPVHASITAALEPGTRVRMWPEGEIGRFSGTLRAPRQPGIYRLTVATGGRAAEIPLIVSADARIGSPSPPGLTSAWATAHGGRVFQARDIGNLPAALNAAIRPRTERTTWHPFRSAWWIVPFVFALSLEWWLRRRQGLR